MMRSDAKPCSRLMRHTAAIYTVGGALGFWVLCRLHYGPKDNCAEESEVGNLWSNINGFNHGLVGSPLQSRV